MTTRRRFREDGIPDTTENLDYYEDAVKLVKWWIGISRRRRLLLKKISQGRPQEVYHDAALHVLGMWDRQYKLSTAISVMVYHWMLNGLEYKTEQSYALKQGSHYRKEVIIKELEKDEWDKDVWMANCLQDLYNALDKLPGRERQVIRGVFGISPCHSPQSLVSISLVQGVTKQRVGQMKDKAMCRLRNSDLYRKWYAEQLD